MDRQATLDEEQPPDLWVVLSENVLRAQVGGPDVMRTQLGRLIEVAGQPTVTLQVLPFGAAAQVQPISPFTILEFAAVRRSRRRVPGAPYRESFPGE